MNSHQEVERISFSQFSEDLLLEVYFSGLRSGYCVEVGALDGLRHSNTLLFEKLGWGCLLIEPIPEMAEACRINRPRASVIECAVVAPHETPSIDFQVAEDLPDLSAIKVGTRNRRLLKKYTERVRLREIRVRARTLDEIFSSANIQGIQFMTLDVEGFEWNALQGFSLSKWKPQVIIVERNQEFPRWRFLRFFAAHGYKLGRRTGVNDWYFYSAKIDSLLIYYARILRRYTMRPLLKRTFGI